MRGNRCGSVAEANPVGSIPAYAGEPAAMVVMVVILRVYPRVCGGTDRAGLPRNGKHGLSPRMRGNPASAPSTRAR